MYIVQTSTLPTFRYGDSANAHAEIRLYLIDSQNIPRDNLWSRSKVETCINSIYLRSFFPLCYFPFPLIRTLYSMDMHNWLHYNGIICFTNIPFAKSKKYTKRNLRIS